MSLILKCYSDVSTELRLRGHSALILMLRCMFQGCSLKRTHKHNSSGDTYSAASGSTTYYDDDIISCSDVSTGGDGKIYMHFFVTCHEISGRRSCTVSLESRKLMVLTLKVSRDLSDAILVRKNKN